MRNSLARLGKTFASSGKKATDWLNYQAILQQDKKSVRGLPVIWDDCWVDWPKQFGCHIEGVDLDENALAKKHNKY